MSEPTLRDPPADPLRLSPGKLRQVRARDLAVRFTFGAATSLVAGLIGIAFGPRAGGLFLAFPAILAASLTLIANEEDRQAAREDSRGAIGGGVAMAAFAAVGATLFTELVAGAVLVVATVAWLAVALGGYAVLWHRRGP
jgi:hypothetical protein